MSPTKEKILEGEEILAKHTKLLAKINDALGKSNGAEAFLGITVLLEIEKTKYEESTIKIEERLKEMRKKHLHEFEVDSGEVNQKMQEVIMRARRYIGKEPVGVSCKIEEAIKKYEAKKFMDQEDKNDLYFELKSLVKFFKEKVR